ncbi:MAG TPA: AAA family ATPase [Candidatus Eremiobacteraceae bacterium]|nr:AAA family ATPase [Candidatus Eremiobacteraceae bacterium]
MVQTPIVFARFAGRRQELADLRARLEEAAQGRGSTILIVGDAGIGKSRLAAQLSADKTADSRLAVGQCFQHLHIPYVPFLAIYRELSGHDLAPQVDRWAQFETITKTINDAAALKPLILVVEDLQWADADSLELFAHVAASIGRSRVLLLATLRAEDARRGDALGAMLAKVTRNPTVARLELARIDDADIQTLIHDVLDSRPGSTAAVSDAVRERAEGNPLFAEELLRTLLDAAAGGSTPSDVPSTVEQIVLERFRQCDRETRAVLESAAVIGRHFSPAFAAAISERPVDQVLEALKSGRDQQLIVEEAGQQTAFVFRHAMTREAIYAQLLGAQRSTLHAKIAAALEGRPGASAIELSYHWRSAGQPAKAAAYDERAGDEAEKIFAHASAAQFYERALDAPRSDDTGRSELFRKFALALHHGGSAAKARDAFAQSLLLIERDGDPGRLGKVSLDLGHLAFNMGDIAAAKEMFERALGVAVSADDVLHFSAHVSLAGLQVFQDNATTALEHLAQAELYKGARPALEHSRFYQFLAIAQVTAGDIDQAVANCTRAADITQEVGDMEASVRALGNVAVNLGKLRARPQTLELFERARGIVKEHRLRSVSAGFCLLQYALTCYRFGDLERARELVTQALAMEIGLQKFGVVAARVGIAVGLLTLDDELVERTARRDFFDLIEGQDESAVPYAACAYIDRAVARGRFDDAHGIVDRTLTALDALADKQTDNVIFVHIAVHGDSGQIKRARELLKRAGTLKHEKEHDARAYLTLFDARFAQRENKPKDARALGALAAAQFHDLGWHLYEAQSLETAGERENALELYKKIGDKRDAQRLETSARRRGRPRASGPQGLSPRELEVGQLIAQGKSNRAISEALTVGERTVETHASAILNKLGLASRAELIAHMARSAPA